MDLVWISALQFLSKYSFVISSSFICHLLYSLSMVAKWPYSRWLWVLKQMKKNREKQEWMLVTELSEVGWMWWDLRKEKSSKKAALTPTRKKTSLHWAINSPQCWDVTPIRFKVKARRKQPSLCVGGSKMAQFCGHLHLVVSQTPGNKSSPYPHLKEKASATWWGRLLGTKLIYFSSHPACMLKDSSDSRIQSQH